MDNEATTLEDIHKPDFEEQFFHKLAEDTRKLVKLQDQFVDTPCPACGGAAHHKVWEYQHLDYHRCGECEMFFICPAPTEEMHLDWVRNSEALRFWREEMGDDIHSRRRKMYQERARFVISTAQRDGVNANSVLEIGAGNGELMRELIADPDSPFETLVALEPQPITMELPGVEIVKSGFDGIPSSLHCDITLAFEVLEHILVPDSFLNAIKSVMRPGGLLILTTPNERSLELRSLMEASSNISFDHVRLYNPTALSRLLERCGFEVIEIATPGKLDVQMLAGALHTGTASFADNPALLFLLKQENPELHSNFQQFLRDTLSSSHMRCVARLKG